MSVSSHPLDVLNESAQKLCLITDLLCHSALECKTELSQEGFQGLLYFLLEMEHDLRMAGDVLIREYREVKP